ncbi:hypothetical protein CLV92_11520 [Kineococcus xinjiangensis]|uniref:Uncharacterized protein n=1 Tax=Kineococcus xinjiangensis TaxID=512762 RepID=A0A2S6IDH3_9ACTN|nr:hypothetical protein [Kineococcus xinjiangensis]PPK92274.1 hypothetical protein CLV92_11520 [Kineococcus xinjiangensis]
MATVVYLTLLALFLAALGRSAIPRRERLPLLERSAADLVADVARGARSLLR